MPLNPQADQLIDTFLTVAFGREPAVKLNQDLRLRRVINASPWLSQHVKNSTERGKLVWTVAHENEHLERMSTSARRSHEARVPRAWLTTQSDRPFDGGSATFLLGRELYCATNAASIGRVWDDFERELVAVASSPSEEHDYTWAIERHLAKLRRHEAKAQASGWNAVASNVENEFEPALIRVGIYPSWTDISRRSTRHLANFIDPSQADSIPQDLRPCLEGQMPYIDGTRDLDPLGRRYFKGTEGLAHNDNPYYNQYAADAISRAILFEQQRNPPRKGGPFHYMSIDMERLKLLPELVQQHGIDPHDSPYPMPYIDKSRGQSIYGEFSDSFSDALKEAELRLDDEGHPEHNLYLQAHTELEKWRTKKWIHTLTLALELAPLRAWEQDKALEQVPELAQSLEQMLERKQKNRLGEKLQQLLKQRPELEETSRPEPTPGLEMEPAPSMEPSLGMEQGQTLWDEGWQQMEAALEPYLELSTSMDTRKKSGLEQQLEQKLEQKLDQANWRQEWRQLPSDPEQRPHPWQGPWQQLWDELWQEQKQEPALQTLYPQDRRGDNLAAALAAQARQAGLSRIDLVEMIDIHNGGRTVLAVQKPCGPSPAMRATVDYPRALYTTIDESSRRLEEQGRTQGWTGTGRPEGGQDPTVLSALSAQQSSPFSRR